MVLAIAFDQPEFGPAQTPVRVPRFADAADTQPAALTRRSVQSTQFGPGAGPTDEPPDQLLIQMHYDEHVAQRDLQRLFESGQLECLGV
jgi:hypothetical protein